MDRRSASILLLAGLVTGALSTLLLPRAAQAQALFAEPVEVDGTTKRYVFMRARR